MHIACGADHGRGSGLVPGEAILRQQWLFRDRQSERGGQRLDSLLAADDVGSADVARIEVSKEADKLVGLRPATGIKRSEPIVALPGVTAGGAAVADQQHHPARGRTTHEAIQHIAVKVPGQLVMRLAESEPAELIHLASGAEGARRRFHRPPADDLLSRHPGVALHIARLAQRPAQSHVVAGFLEHLADGAVDLALAGGQLPLRERPVVVALAVDDGHLDGGRAVGFGGDAP